MGEGGQTGSAKCKEVPVARSMLSVCFSLPAFWGETSFEDYEVNNMLMQNVVVHFTSLFLFFYKFNFYGKMFPHVF